MEVKLIVELPPEPTVTVAIDSYELNEGATPALKVPAIMLPSIRKCHQQ
jgi:hypothetical protein